MKRLIFCFLCLMLFGCEPSSEHDDLKSYIAKTYSSAKATATPVPPEPHYVPMPFLGYDVQDPFVFPLSSGKENYARGTCWQPDDLPGKDPLESLPLESLSFKGVMGSEGDYWALLEGADKSIYRVGIGRVLGLNRGRVESISQNSLSITEHLPDGLGCWQVRHVRLTLTHYDKG